MKKLLPAGLLAAAACTTSLDEPPKNNPPPKVARSISHLEARDVARESVKTFAVKVILAVDDLDASALAGNFNLKLRAQACPAAPDPSGGGAEPVPCDVKTPDDLASETADAFVDAVFKGENVVGNEATQVTYRLSSDICPAQETGETDPGGAPIPPPQETRCEEYLSQHELLLKVQSYAEGELELTASLDGSELAKGTLSGESAGVDVELASLRTLLEGLGDLQGFTALTGRIGVEASSTGDLVRAALVVRTPVEVAFSDEKDFRVAISPGADPLMQTLLDSSGDNVEAKVAFDAIDASLPLAMFGSSEDATCAVDPNNPEGCVFEPAPEPQGNIDVALGRNVLSVEADTQGNAFAVHRTGATSGFVTVQYGGSQAFHLDLSNLSGTVSAEDSGALAAFETGMNLGVEFALSQIATQIDVPSWMVTENIRFELGGASRPTVWFEGASSDVASSGSGDPVPPPENLPTKVARVVEGFLSLSANALAAPVRVETGSCLFSSEAEGGPMAGMSSGPCN